MGNLFGKCFKHSNDDFTPTTSIEDISTFEPLKNANVPKMLMETENIDARSAANIVRLFENENTIPFICRYRRNLIDQSITPEKLRIIKLKYNEFITLQNKAESMISQIEKKFDISDDLRTRMFSARTDQELEFLNAPYKFATNECLGDRAKLLDFYADCLLYGKGLPISLEAIIDHKIPELTSIEKVSNVLCNTIAQIISKHTGVLDELRRLQKVHKIRLKCTKVNIDTYTKGITGKDPPHATGNRNDQLKYELYFQFDSEVCSVKPHQILAINRGEKSKFLSVEIVVPELFKVEIQRYICGIYMCSGIKYVLRNNLFQKAFEECYSTKLVPLISQQVRANLDKDATKASIDVFAKNLKQLLLMSPLKGERILGIDPGFTHGCKLAMISETADVLEVGVMFPHVKRGDPKECGIRLAKVLARNRCKIIALGNGTACRETEIWLTDLFQKGILDPERVSYSIVSEKGTSIYSCSDVAKKEFPKFDVNHISAISIARRLNDPLSEYVKLEPRHIGVGMYQHDIDEKILSETLNEVVSECVSFVGVDINTASLSILRHIAGLTEKSAEKIIQYRKMHGPFRTRMDLMQVNTIDVKTFIQCAGFIRIEPMSIGGSVKNSLDCTWVHPESYAVAQLIITKCNLNLKDIGKPEFIAQIRHLAREPAETLANIFGIPYDRLQVVLIALQRQLFQDYRSDFNKKPLFKKGITRLEDLFIGEIVTGAVENITTFGAFVDIGIERNGLIHKSNMNKIKLNIGDRVSATVLDTDLQRKRINLRLDELIKV